MSAETLRELIDRDEILVVPGIFDGLTTKIIEDIGFEAVYLGGFSAGASLAASEPLTTLTEMCDRAREISHSSDLPLIVDAGAGFGNPVHVSRVVKEFAKNGVAAIHLEDQVYPKRVHYHRGIQHLVDTDEMVRKIEIAAETRDDLDEDMLLIGRTDAYKGQRKQFETIDDAVDRVNAYLDAGADVGYLPMYSEEDIEYVFDHVDGPLTFFNAEYRDNPSLEELESAGYSMTLYGLSASLAVGKHVRAMYQTLFEEGHTGIEREEARELNDYIVDVIGMQRLFEIEEASGNK